MALTDYLSDIGDAIRTKTGGTALIPFLEMPEEILSIPTGGGGVVEKDVNFYTPYGDLVASWTMAEARAATALPAAPTLDRLTFQEWNWTLVEIQDFHSEIDVCGTYTTTSGNTELDMVFNGATGLNVTLRINNRTAGEIVDVDWGDGTNNSASSSTTGEKVFTHTYPGYGEYMISVSSNGNYSFFGQTSGTYNTFNVTPNYTCVACRGGIGLVNLDSHCFRGVRSLRSFTLPTSCIINFANVFFDCVGLTFIGFARQQYFNAATSQVCSGCFLLQRASLPRNTGTLASGFFTNCYSLQAKDVGLTAMPSTGYQFNYSLEKYVIRSASNIPSSAFANCYNLLEFFILRGTLTTLANVNVFTSLNPLCKIKVPQGMLAEYQAATNWSTFANQIVEMTNEEMERYGLAVTP